MKKRRNIDDSLTPDAVSTWLQAEAAGDEAASEAALHQIFGVLPRVGPGADFAARITNLALDVNQISPSVAVAAPRAVHRWMIAAVLTVLGGLVTLGLPLWLFVLQTVPPGRWLSTPIQWFAALFAQAQFLADSLAVLGDLWRAGVTVLTAWPVVLAGSLLLALSVVTWQWICRPSSGPGRLDYA